MGVRTANVQPGNIGETLTGLAEVIHGRRDASPQESYTARLLTDAEDELLKKLAEEASEVIMACKDNDHDHIRYEAGDLVYHLLVTLERYGIAPEDSIAFGDGGNDASMLRMCGIGVAMGNASPDAIAAADYVTDDVDHDGIARALDHFAGLWRR